MLQDPALGLLALFLLLLGSVPALLALAAGPDSGSEAPRAAGRRQEDATLYPGLRRRGGPHRRAASGRPG
ncbi:hypothetical protein [Paracraurococcus ruber]|nr:hypothetical protein [Paracraurococcus ruber]MBK1662422.1 hypothetical protein [Paracraurococcus ruber]TDG11708.1 hypothetical protein E2C05_30725 [Paracraurococcus ruber]